MADVLLDTTVFVDAYIDHPELRPLLAQIRNGALRAYYSSVTVFEFMAEGDVS